MDSGQMTALGLSRNRSSVWLVDDQLSLFMSSDGGPKGRRPALRRTREKLPRGPDTVGADLVWLTTFKK